MSLPQMLELVPMGQRSLASAIQPIVSVSVSVVSNAATELGAFVVDVEVR